jgi:predicted dehydrogenase
MAKKIRVLVAGCGHMGTSHARAYHQMADAFEIVGLVSRGADSRQRLNAEFGGRYAEFADYQAALAQTRPDAVCISTYSETHADYACAAMEAGAHVFLEKPVAARQAARHADEPQPAERRRAMGHAPEPPAHHLADRRLRRPLR